MNVVRARLAVLVLFACTSSVAISGAQKTGQSAQYDKRTTHLNVRVGEIVNLETFCLPNDGTSGLFWYDRSSVPFDIPQGHSFVVTDIIAQPFCTGSPDPDARWHLVVEGSLGRSFEVAFRGDSIVHYALSGGIAYTSDNVPAVRTIRDPALSTGSIEIQVLGYFVKGNALAPSTPRF